MKSAPYTGAYFFRVMCIFLGEAYSGLKASEMLLLLAIILNIDGGKAYETFA
jgi:hypothetical protein